MATIVARQPSSSKVDEVTKVMHFSVSPFRNIIYKSSSLQTPFSNPSTNSTTAQIRPPPLSTSRNNFLLHLNHPLALTPPPCRHHLPSCLSPTTNPLNLLHLPRAPPPQTHHHDTGPAKRPHPPIPTLPQEPQKSQEAPNSPSPSNLNSDPAPPPFQLLPPNPLPLLLLTPRVLRAGDSARGTPLALIHNS